MALSGAMSLRKAVARRDFLCGVAGFCRDSGITAVPPLPHSRCIHVSSSLSGKSSLHKFSGNKKKPWYHSPYLPTDNKPSGLMALMKKPQQENRGNNIRIRTLNKILYDALTSLLSTAEVSEEVYDLQIELSKVSLPADFSVCRAYWLGSGNKDSDAEAERILQKYAPRFRHLMISHHIIGKVPPVVFVRDKEDAKRQQVEDLLTLLQSEMENCDSSIKTETVSRELDSESHTEVSTIQPLSMFGIDHVELNHQILEYKKKVADKFIVTDHKEMGLRQQEQLAQIRKQNLQKKKMKRSKGDYVSPRDYLLATEMERQGELDSDLQEDVEQYEEEEEETSDSTPK